MNEREKEIRKRLRDDYEHYAEKCLKIRAKQAIEIDGQKTKIVPFRINKAQKYIHQRLEDQRRRTGKVRSLILKGRQQGCSTYVGGRFYHRTTHKKGIKTFILTHRDDATTNLFNMVKRFHEHCPKIVKAHTSYSNKIELVFDKLDSAYGLGTAAGGSIGRSDTIDLFHGSEVAFWKNVSDIKTGIFQAAEMADEIILESTANGYDAMFYPMWGDALRGIGRYEAIFVPWYWQDEYRSIVPDGFKLDEEESEYFRLYKEKGLVDMGQMAWRREKIIELKDPLLFKQEYPATSAEAFQVTGADSFIPVSIILKARANTVEPGPIRIIGVDPARFGDDATAIADRRGRKLVSVERIYKKSTMHIAGLCKKILDEKDVPVRKMFIDVGGLGAGIVDRLHELGYRSRVEAVNFGESAYDEARYYNRRAEMYGGLKEWLEDPRGVDIPDSDTLQSDISAPGYSYDSTQRIKIEKKEDVKKRILRSTDEADATVLTFAVEILNAQKQYTPDRSRRHIVNGGVRR